MINDRNKQEIRESLSTSLFEVLKMFKQKMVNVQDAESLTSMIIFVLNSELSIFIFRFIVDCLNYNLLSVFYLGNLTFPMQRVLLISSFQIQKVLYIERKSSTTKVNKGSRKLEKLWSVYLTCNFTYSFHPIIQDVMMKLDGEEPNVF